MTSFLKTWFENEESKIKGTREGERERDVSLKEHFEKERDIYTYVYIRALKVKRMFPREKMIHKRWWPYGRDFTEERWDEKRKRNGERGDRKRETKDIYYETR